MKALVIYESMYGNTRAIAEAIADGLRGVMEAHVAPVKSAQRELTERPTLIVVGGPTHVHGMSRPATRKAAIEDGRKPDRTFTVDPDAEGAGVRELLASIERLNASAAAYDTRLRGPGWLTGRASKGIARSLRRRGCSLIARPESFLVTKENTLASGELDRARRWGAEIARAVDRDSIPSTGTA